MSSSVSVNSLRSLIFDGSIPISITIAETDLSDSVDKLIDTYYMQASRITYLPVLLPSIRQHLLELIINDPAVSNAITDDEIWFDYDGIPLRWHWPVGLLYDYHTAHHHLQLPNPGAIANSSSHRDSKSRARTLPFRLTMHLKNRPTDTLLIGASIESCRTAFMNMVKEADFVRWGSVKRVTNLRKEQQDALWDGVIQSDFDKFWQVASKLLPLPSPIIPSPSSDSTSTRISSPIDGGSKSRASALADGRPLEGNNMRSVPMRIYLPDGGPVLQDIVAPLMEGTPTTLFSHLTTILPLLFPINEPALASVIVHGITLPLETELGWLGACLAGADGWIAAVIVVNGVE